MFTAESEKNALHQQTFQNGGPMCVGRLNDYWLECRMITRPNAAAFCYPGQRLSSSS